VVQRVVEGAGGAGAVWGGVRDDLLYGIWGLSAVVNSRFSVLGCEDLSEN